MVALADLAYRLRNAPTTNGHADDHGSMSSKCPCPSSGTRTTRSPAATAAGILLAHGERHRAVGCPMDQNLRHMERQHLRR